MQDPVGKMYKTFPSLKLLGQFKANSTNGPFVVMMTLKVSRDLTCIQDGPHLWTFIMQTFVNQPIYVN